MNEPRQLRKIPKFDYHLSSPQHRNYGCIVAGDVVFHRVTNFDEFYRALGYDEDMRAEGMLPDEFIWEKYTRDNAPKARQCLQPKIIGYLYNRSERFKEEYGSEYANLVVGKCTSAKIDDSLLCLNCIMHPRFLPA